MAEGILSDLATKILEGLGSLIVQEIGLASAGVLTEELKKLEESLSRVNAILLDAEKKGTMNNVVKDWLIKLKDVVYDAEDVLDELATEALRQEVKKLPKYMVVKQVHTRFPRSITPEFFSDIAHRIKDIIESLVHIRRDGELVGFQFITDQNGVDNDDDDDDDTRHTINPFVIESEVLLGSEEDKEKPVELRLITTTPGSEKVASIESLYHLNDENECESLFNEGAFGEGEEGSHPNPKLVEIGKDIVKKCGGVPLSAKAIGSLLCLTRDEKDWLDVLNSEIWNLDEQEIQPALMICYHHLPSHLKQCFAYCSMFPQDHEMDVHDLIHQWMAHGFIIEPPPQGGGVSSSSSSSSHGTTTETLEDMCMNGYFRELLRRSFFYEVRKYDLGLDENVLGKVVMSCKMPDLVHKLARFVAGNEWSEVNYLLSSGNTPGVRRHIVIDDALLTNHQTDLIPLDEEAQKLRTLYVKGEQRGNYYGWGSISIVGYDELRISERFLSSVRCLRVLKLRGLGMEPVPSSIGDLVQLRYLDLSENPFEKLPNSICKLYNLQTLILETCPKFNEWPRDMSKMVSLRHLELWPGYNSSLEYMPRGLGQLVSLQTLGTFYVGDQNNNTRRRRSRRRKRSSSLKMVNGQLGELHGLNQLRGYLHIENIGRVRDGGGAEEAKLKEKSELQYLRLSFWNRSSRENGVPLEDEQVLGNLQPHPNLKGLRISIYHGVKMPRWMIDCSSLLPNLVELTISQCGNLKCLPLIGEFPCLRSLWLGCFESLESICTKVGGGGVKGEGKPLMVTLFPLLERLNLFDLPNLESWTISVAAEEEEVAAQEDNHSVHLLLSSMFPSLTDLSLEKCNKLTTVPMLSSVWGFQHLTSLQKLKIDGVERLESLPVDCPAPATLEELHIEFCPSLVKFPDCFFENLKLLSDFRIMACPQLASVPEGIQHLTALKLLHISNCPALTTLPEGLGNLASLQELGIWYCGPNFNSLPEGIKHLAALETLNIYSCPGLKALPEGLGNLASLQVLDITDCPNLNSVPEGIQHLTTLQKLRISSCDGLNTLPEGLGNLTSFKSFIFIFALI